MITECPHCEWTGSVEDEYKGIESECPSCEKSFVIKSLGKKVEEFGLPKAGHDREVSTEGTEPILIKEAIKPKQAKKKSLLARFFVMSLALSVCVVGSRLFI